MIFSLPFVSISLLIISFWAYCWKHDTRNIKCKAYVLHKILICFSICSTGLFVVSVISR